MNYQAMATPTVTYLGTPDFKFKAVGTRQMMNTGGGSITIKEVGIYAKGRGYDAYCHCIVRDVLAVTVTCPDPSQVTATYTLYTAAIA
jgi:hypothetical protein